jgi:PhnB protein
LPSRTDLTALKRGVNEITRSIADSTVEFPRLAFLYQSALISTIAFAKPVWRRLIAARQAYLLATIEARRNPMAEVNFIPKGYHSVTPHLIIKGAAEAIDYYKDVFGATEMFRMDDGGKVGHAEIKIGDSTIMLADEYPELGFVGPKTIGGSASGLMIYVEDVDTIFNRAIAKGGVQLKPVKDQFYGDRSGSLTDPWGHVWTVATHKEDVTPEEMDQRAAAAKGNA